MRAGETKVLAQKIYEKRSPFDVAGDGLAVYGHGNCRHSFSPKRLFLTRPQNWRGFVLFEVALGNFARDLRAAQTPIALYAIVDIRYYFDISGIMDLKTETTDHLDAAQAFAALGSEARLEIVRTLVRAAPEGLTVGALQERLGMAGSTLSHHLKFLSQCALVSQERDGRSLICRAEVERIEALAGYLTRECCADASAAQAAE